MRKLVIMMICFAVAIWTAGLVYGIIFSSDNPYKPITSIDMQQAIAATDTAPAADHADHAHPATQPVAVKSDTVKADANLLPDRVLGDAKAPVTIIEYASFTCSHCAQFHKETLPQIKKDYIDKGLAKLILRPFPFDGIALKGSVMAYCLPSAQYYPFIDALYKGQDQWARSADPEAELKKIARLAGLSDAEYAKCSDPKGGLSEAIVRGRMNGEKQFGVQSTPTFIVGGEKIEGARAFAGFKLVLDAQIIAAKKSN